MATRKKYESHGESYTRLYKVWKNIKKRCNCTTTDCYETYGGRGIKMCKEWEDSFVAFRDWAFANGYKEDALPKECTIDRIDNQKGYSPDNCRWADWRTQQNNRRANVYVTYNGQTHTIAEWARITGMSFTGMMKRYRNGWSPERMITTPRDERCIH